MTGKTENMIEQREDNSKFVVKDTELSTDFNEIERNLMESGVEEKDIIEYKKYYMKYAWIGSFLIFNAWDEKRKDGTLDKFLTDYPTKSE